MRTDFGLATSILQSRMNFQPNIFRIIYFIQKQMPAETHNKFQTNYNFAKNSSNFSEEYWMKALVCESGQK